MQNHLSNPRNLFMGLCLSFSPPSLLISDSWFGWSLAGFPGYFDTLWSRHSEEPEEETLWDDQVCYGRLDTLIEGIHYIENE